MPASNLVRFGICVVAFSATFTAGCASAPGGRTAAKVPGLTQRTALAETKTPAGFWGSLKSWNPKRFLQTDDKPKLKNPGKLHLAYARWQEQLGNIVEARESYELALGDDPKSVDAVLGLARLDQLNGRTAEAEQRYLKVLKFKPNDPAVLDAIGQFYASQERWNEAIGKLKQAMQIAPEDTSYRYNLAVALARSGRISESMPHFSRTVGDAEAHYNIGYILYKQGDLASAERQFQQALVARPNLTEAKQMYDVVRRDQADRQMLADRRPPGVQSNAQIAYQTEDGFSRPPASNNPQGKQYETADPRYQVTSSDRDSSNRFNYRTTQPVRSTNDPVSAAQTQGGTRAADRQTLAPWHTAPVFDNQRNPLTQRSQYNASQLPYQDNLPSTPAVPVSAGGHQRPTPEQLEQWRNQLSPESTPAGY